MSELASAVDHPESFTKALRLIVLASGDYFILTNTVSDVVVEALQQHCDFLAKMFRSRLGDSTSPITLHRLIASFSDCKLHLSRILTYLSTYAFASTDPEISDATSFGTSSKALSLFHAECEKLNIQLDEATTSPFSRLLLAGQHIRMRRIDEFATGTATTEQYLDFTRLRQRARLLGPPFVVWMVRAGLPLQRSGGGVETIPILAYLVTLCLRDVIDLALVNRQKFGINLQTQMTGIELQQASLYIQKVREYL